jgi:hypothetical protein
VYEHLLHLLHASLPEFLGSLMAGFVLATSRWGAKKTRDRVRTRRTRDDARQLSDPADGEHRRAA